MSEILLLAYLMAFTAGESSYLPPCWSIVEEVGGRIGTEIDVFECGEDRVIAFNGTNSAVDLGVAIYRRISGGPEWVVEFARERADRNTVLVGHSQGGALASFVAGELGLVSVTFNSGRPAFALRNSGQYQLNYVIDGDNWGNPFGGFYGSPLPGVYVVLCTPNGVHPHLMMAFVVALLEGE